VNLNTKHGGSAEREIKIAWGTQDFAPYVFDQFPGLKMNNWIAKENRA